MDAKKKKKQIRPSGFPVPVARMYQQGPETNYNNHISPTWKCKRENCNGVLTLLGNVKKHMTNLSEARARAAQKAREFPATFVHGAKLSCNKCGDRPAGERRRHSSWQRLCQICGETYAMNAFWRMHGGVNHKGVRTDLKLRAHVHKNKLRLKFLTNAEVSRLDNMLSEEKIWLDLANRKIIDRGKAEISNKVIENHKMNQLESRYAKTSSSKRDVKSVLQKMQYLDDIRQMVHDGVVIGAEDDVVKEEEKMETEDYKPKHPTQKAPRRVRFNASEIQRHHSTGSQKKEPRKRVRSRSSDHHSIKMSPKSPKLFVGASPNSPYGDSESRRKSPGKRLEDIPERIDDGAVAFDAMMQAEEEIALFENASPGELGLFDIVMDDDLDGLNDEGEDLSLLTKDFDVFDSLLDNVTALREVSSSFDALNIVRDGHGMNSDDESRM